MLKLATEKKIIWALILAYVIFFGIFTSLRHYNFQTQTWDMGIFVQTFWNTIHGNVMQNSIEEASNHLGVHMSPFLFLLVPFYALFPSPYTLLILQTVFVALGAWPLYLLAKNLLPPKWPLILSAGYLLYPILHWITIFDFHEISFLPTLLLAAFYFLQKQNWLWSGIFLTLSASAKEDAIILVAFVGLYLLLKKSSAVQWWNAERKMGLAVLLLAIGYFLLATKVIMPALGGGLLRLDRYAQFGSAAPEILKNIFLKPDALSQTLFNAEKFRYVLWLFLPVAFLPFFSGRVFLLLIPGLLENLLTNFQSQFASFYQYDSILIPAIFFSAVYGLKNILDRWREKGATIKWALIAAIIAGYAVRSPINPVFFPTEIFKSNAQWSAYRQMVKSVPADPKLTVAAHTNLIPHLSDRKHAYMLGTEPFPADYVLIDGADGFGFLNADAFQAYVDNYANSGQYEILVIENRYIILKKKGL